MPIEIPPPSPLNKEGIQGGIILRFQYRELTEEEVKTYGVEGGSNTAKQGKINQKTYQEIQEKIKDTSIKAHLSQEHKPVSSHVMEGNGKGNEKPLLLYQLSRFTAKNTKDYFIHKNLKRFLSEQLDYFIKAEVLDIETLEKERFLDKHITRAKVVKEIGEDIIDFLSQIEEFQKRLWEKKKFVLKTEYVITTDRVPQKFYDEIFNNQAQKKEWEELRFDIPESEKDLKDRKLPVDTKYFSMEFKEKLLEKVTEKDDLDDLLDGILIKSENWQALNLLLGKYKEKVQTIYIDPPFNLGTNADFLYNVNYKDSSWVSILENRLQLAINLLDDKGSIFVRCDYNGNMYVRLLMNEVFGEGNFRNEIDLKRTRTLKGEGLKFHTSNDTLFFWAKDIQSLIFNGYKKLKEKSEWVRMHLPGTVKGNAFRIVFSRKIYPPSGRKWVLDQKGFDKAIEDGIIKWDDEINEPLFLSKYETIGSDWSDIPSYTFDWNFPTENSEILLKRVIESTSSPHTPLNKGGQRGDCTLNKGEIKRGIKYLFILGEKEGKDMAIVWREYDDSWSEDDFKKDKEFIIRELESWAPSIIYINGQSVLTPALGKHTVEIRYTESEFSRLMET